jgi:hypothetical protein
MNGIACQIVGIDAAPMSQSVSYTYSNDTNLIVVQPISTEQISF